MLLQSIDLTCDIGNGLTLREPFWIASCHLTSRPSVLRAWRRFSPAALTLKTSKRNPKVEAKPSIRYRLGLDPSVSRFGKSLYCDGSKHKEFLTYDATAKLLKLALEVLPKTKIGLSVLAAADEDYAELRSSCPEAHFAELNLKYSFRVPSGTKDWRDETSKAFESILSEVERFCGAFKGLPVFVKLSRELSWLPATGELDKLLDILAEHGQAGLVASNTRKQDVPGFVTVDGEERALVGGVMCGEALFDDTIQVITGIAEACKVRAIPIVATGGMVEEGQILHAFRAGACAAQLCTAFEYYRLSYYRTLVSALRARIFLQGLNSFKAYLQRVPAVGVSAMYAAPFHYYSGFWDKEVQQSIAADIRTSERMDVFIMSGRSLSEKWESLLRERFKRNLGARIFVPNPKSDVYTSVQRAWGIVEPDHLAARRKRIEEAITRFRTFWEEAKPDRTTSIARATAEASGPEEADAVAASADERSHTARPETNERDGTTDEHEAAVPIGRDAHQIGADDERTEARLELIQHDQCPFYSCYAFDDKVYVSPYPFVRPDDLAIPVYVFFGNSKEYARIRGELDSIEKRVAQTRA
jgi:dihydroorotate dehydrogenase